MKIETLVVGMVAADCYIAYDEASGRGFIVDPGDEADRIILCCSRLSVKPEAVLLTHGHFDHMTAASSLHRHYGIPVYAGAEEKSLLADARANLSALWASPCTLTANVLLADGQQLEVGGFLAEVLCTPGHTPGGVCYYLKEQRVLFSGDTLFAGSYGRTDFPGGSTAALMRSIREKLLVLPEDTVVYPGHGEATSVGYEKKHNPAAK